MRRYLMEHTYTADDYIALLETFSGHRAMALAARTLLLAEIRRRIEARPDGRLRKHLLVTLHVARRAPSRR